MTTPTPPTWMTCDHRGIGLPGCPTCDGRLDPETRRMLLELAQFTTAKVIDAHAAEAECARLRETLGHLTAAMNEPHGIGPWTRVGGPMPDPWPGMGVKVRLTHRDGWAMYLCEPVCVDGVVYATTVGEPGVSRRLDEVAEVWDGRRCIWKRE